MGAAAMGSTSLAMGGVGGLLGAAGSILGGNSQAANDRYQAQVAMNNAGTAAKAGDTALAQGQVAAQQQYQVGSQRQGQARAAFGADGVSANSGSAVDVQSGIARTTALDVGAVGYNADVQAVGLRNQVANYDTQANVDRTAASNAVTSGFLGAAGSLIGSASSVSSKWASMQQAGVFTPPENATIDGYKPVSPNPVTGQNVASNPWASSMLSGAY